MSQQERYNRMIRNLSNSKTLYNFQQKLATYKNNKEPNYVRAVLNTRPLLFARVLRAYTQLPEKMKQFGIDIVRDVNQNSSPRLLFDALKKLEALNTMARRGSPALSMLTKPSEPINAPKYTMEEMVNDLSKSNNFSSYGKKMVLYQNQKNYSKALVKAKAKVADRVRTLYEQLSENQQKKVNAFVDVNAAKNKNANPVLMFNALREMRRFRSPRNQSWRFE
jgi:hypothetical protein